MEAGTENVVTVGRGEGVEGVSSGELDWMDLADALGFRVRISVHGTEPGLKRGVGSDLGMGFRCRVVGIEAG